MRAKARSPRYSPDIEALLRVFESRENKKVGLLVVARFADANAVHHSFTERQL